MKLYLKTITPVHIGNGEELYALDYVMNNNFFYKISQHQFLEFLSKHNISYQYYAEWINTITQSIDDLKNEKRKNKWNKDINQQLSETIRNFNLLNFVKSNKIKKEKEFIKYLDTHVQINKIPFQIKPKNQIRGHLKTAFNQPYIPGTSIKGAIRTALLYNYLINTADVEIITEIIKNELRRVKSNPKEKENIKKRFADKIEQLAFYCEMQKENKEVKYDDEKSDILKLLLVSDSKITIQENNLGLANADLYLVSKIKDRNSNSFRFVADKQPQAPSLEVIPKNKVIEFDIDFNIDFLLSIKAQIQNDAIIIKEGKNKEVKQWLGIKRKVKTIFNLDIDAITKENKEELRKTTINNILECVFTFSVQQKKWDTIWISNLLKHEIDKDRNGFPKFKKEHLQKGFNHNSNRSVHIGFGSGFTGITELLYLLDNEELKKIFKEAMEVFGIGDKPGAQKLRRPGQKYEANPDNFPKSKRLISGKDIIEPIGWLQIISETDAEKIKEQTNAQLHSSSVESANLQSTSVSAPAQPPKPTYFTGKLKIGDIVDAQLVAIDNTNTKIKIFHLLLFEPGKEQEVKLSYFSDLTLGAFFQVKITNIQKNQVINIQFVKQLK
ncbi:MAG: type III-A CRISPR-associated RAMP protein Csm5 [Bacteroidetes bacterium GWA2_32_17]|nr:MAG: type III-A CRISPR-associated RAMP protein Csm5 [Bacteroidetes bacterium GWA2_32_17]